MKPLRTENFTQLSWSRRKTPEITNPLLVINNQISFFKKKIGKLKENCTSVQNNCLKEEQNLISLTSSCSLLSKFGCSRKLAYGYGKSTSRYLVSQLPLSIVSSSSFARDFLLSCIFLVLSFICFSFQFLFHSSMRYPRICRARKNFLRITREKFSFPPGLVFCSVTFIQYPIFRKKRVILYLFLRTRRGKEKNKER